MTRTSRSAAPRLRPDAPMPSPEQFVSPQMRHLQAVQSRLLDETRTFHAAWAERRRQAIADLGDLTAEMIAAGPDTGRAAHALDSWRAGARARLAADAEDWMRLWLRCAQHVVREVNETESEWINGSAEIVRLGGHGRHATPI